MPGPRPSSRARLATVGAALVALALLAAACGGGGDDDATDDTATGSTTTVSTSAGEEPTTTATAPLSPPTTRGVPEPVDVDPLPDAMPAVTVLSGEPAYRGVLGQIDPDRYVVAPVALPPAPAPAGVAPLTGLTLDDPAVAERPAILAKIDNTAKGRPQASLT
ncbi:MAG: hypothetical protein D6683_16175, partial [Actinomyces sp.]